MKKTAHPAFHERCFAQTRLAGDEHDLARRFDRIFEPRVELAKLAVATDKAGTGAFGFAARFLRVAAGQEPVATAMKGLDEFGLIGIIIERPANFQDSPLQNAFGDVNIRPYRVEQFLLCDQPAPPFSQVEQHGKSFW